MSDIKVQRGLASVPNTGSTAAPGTSFGSLSSAFVLVSNNRRMSTGANNQSAATVDIDDISGGVHLASVNSIEFDRESGSSATFMRFAWESWEYVGAPGGVNEFVVRGRVKLTLTTESVTSIISGIVDVDRCVPYITGILSNGTVDDADSATAIAWMSGTDTLNVKRGSGNSNTVRVYVTVVEFTGSDWSVGHAWKEGTGTDSGTLDLVTGSDGVSGSTFDVGDWGNAFIVHQYKANALFGIDDSIADTSAIYQRGTTSTVDWQFHTNHVDSAVNAGSHEEHFVHVVRHPYIKVTVFTDSQSLAGPMNVDISSASLSDMASASVEVSRNSSGTGTAYGRGWVDARIASLTTVELWAHRSGNTISSVVQVIDLADIQIGITSMDDGRLFSGETGNTATGHGFGATQGTGKIELASNADYTGTIVQQTVVTWSDTSIVFDSVQGALSDGIVYLFVTNGAGLRSSGFRLILGVPPYDALIADLSPDHWWELDGDYTDRVGGNTMNISVVGTQNFVTPICEKNTFSSEFTSVTSAREASDSSFMNVGITFERTMGGWIQVDSVQQSLGAFYKEGGGVNNLAFLFGLGNVLMAQLADTGNDNVQAYSDFKLGVNRPYHIMFRFSYYEQVKEFRLFIDGVKQTNTDGNPLQDIDLDSHPADVVWGKPDAALEMGGTNVSFQGNQGCRYAQWVTWTRALAETDIRQSLFERGALPDVTISSGTEAAMQSSLDALANTVRPDAALAIRVEGSTSNSDIRLVANNITFDPGCSIHVQYSGPGVLTWVNGGGSNAKITSTIGGGSIVLIQSVTIDVTVRDVTDNALISGARVYLVAGAGGALPQGTVILNGVTDSNGFISASLDYSIDQPLTGRARKAGTAPFYKTSGISGTVTFEGLSLSVFMVPDDG